MLIFKIKTLAAILLPHCQPTLTNVMYLNYNNYSVNTGGKLKRKLNFDVSSIIIKSEKC